MSKRKRPLCESCRCELSYSYGTVEYRIRLKHLCQDCRDAALTRAVEIPIEQGNQA